MGDSASSARDRELLERHRPLLRYDAQDDMRAMSAHSATEPGSLLRRGDGELLAGPDGSPELTLELLATYAEPTEGDHLVLAPDPARTARRLQKLPGYADRVYGHVVRDAGGTWLQYWLWLYDNPKNLFGLGAHQGDWELVQVALDSRERPVAATCSQHDFGEPRRWARVSRHPGPDGPRPVVYVAVLSHALYFAPGTHPYLVGIDHAYAGGPECDVGVEAPAAWVEWVGRWGRPPATAFPRLGRPPRSPGRQEKRWRTPSRFHRWSWWRLPARALGRLLHAAGRLTFPAAPGLEATAAGELVRVDVALAGAGRRRPGRHAYVTVHDADGRHVLAGRALRDPGARAVVTLRVPEVPPRALVRASAFNRLRQRSDVSTVEVARA